MKVVIARICLLLCLLFMLPFQVANAQTTPSPELLPSLQQRFDANAHAAAEILRKPPLDHSDQARSQVATLRSKLAADRDLASELVDRSSTDIRIVQAQIDALGPVPGDGKIEPPVVTQRRDQLNQKLGQLMVPMIGMREAQIRASTLVDDIDARIMVLKREELMERGFSPLNPGVWTGAAGDIAAGFERMAASLSSASVKWGAGTLVLALIGGLFLLAITPWVAGKMIIGVSRFMEKRNARATSVVRRMSYLLLHDAISAAALFLLVLLLAAGVTLLLFPILPLAKITQLWIALLIAGAPIAIGDWLGRSAFNSPFPGLRLLMLPPDRIKAGTALVRQMAMLIGAEVIVNAIEFQGLVSVNVSRLLSVALIFVGSWLVWKMSNLLIEAREYSNAERAAQKADPDQPDPRPAFDFATPISRLLRLFAIGSVVAALVGYVMLSRQILTGTLISLALIGVGVYLNRAIALVLHAAADGPLAAYRRILHLIPLLAGVILTVILVPLIAIIWGYSSDEMGDAFLALRRGIEFGAVKISIGDVFTFGAVFFIGFFLTRMLQRFLKISILPDFEVEAGAQSAILTGVGYIGIFLAAVVAIATTGLDLSSLAFVAGAFSVGLGFGLQSVIENFTSGILLLIERPVKEGDWIEVGEYSGIVRKIAVRSTHIETFDRHEIIIPNSKLITEAVKNRSFTGGPTRIAVPIGVAYGSDLDKVQEVLLDIARKHKLVLHKPAPSVGMDGFGDSAINLKLLGFVSDVTKASGVQSDLMLSIARRFAAEGISIPFPQQELFVKNWPDTGRAKTAPSA